MDRRSVLKSLSALVVSPLDALAPSSPKTPGLVFDSADDDCLAEMAKECQPFIWIIATDHGYKQWNGEEFVYTELLQ